MEDPFDPVPYPMRLAKPMNYLNAINQPRPSFNTAPLLWRSPPGISKIWSEANLTGQLARFICLRHGLFSPLLEINPVSSQMEIQKDVPISPGFLGWVLKTKNTVSSDSFHYIVYPVGRKPIRKVITALKCFKKNPFFQKRIKRRLD